MAKLYLEVKNQTLSVRCDIDRIVENSVNYLEYEVIFRTEDWNSITGKRIVITYNNGKSIKQQSLTDEKIIPHEALHSPGFAISLVGENTSSGKVVNRIPTSQVYIKVYPSGEIYGDNVQVEFPSASFESQFDELKGIVEVNTEKIEDLEQSIGNTENWAALREDVNKIETETIPSLREETNVALAAIEGSIGTTNSNLETTNSNLETLSQKVDGLKIASKVENNVLYIYYEDTLEKKEG